MAEEKKNIKFGQIGNALRSAASDHVTAVASDIFDEGSQKYQNAINAELDTSIKSEAQARTENDRLLSRAISEELDRAMAAEQANATSIIGTERIADGAVTSDKLVDGALIEQLKNTATFAGIATPTTNPGTPDGPVFYLATEVGVYSNFGGIEVIEGEAVIFEWDNGSWSKKVTGFATQKKLTELSLKVSGIDDSNEETFTDTGFKKYFSGLGIKKGDKFTLKRSGTLVATRIGICNSTEWNSSTIVVSSLNLSDNEIEYTTLVDMDDMYVNVISVTSFGTLRLDIKKVSMIADAIDGSVMKEKNIAENAITTSKIADGAVQPININETAFDDTLSTSRKLADAKIVGDKFTEQELKLTELVDTKVDELKIGTFGATLSKDVEYPINGAIKEVFPSLPSVKSGDRIKIRLNTDLSGRFYLYQNTWGPDAVMIYPSVWTDYIIADTDIKLGLRVQDNKSAGTVNVEVKIEGMAYKLPDNGIPKDDLSKDVLEALDNSEFDAIKKIKENYFTTDGILENTIVSGEGVLVSNSSYYTSDYINVEGVAKLFFESIDLVQLANIISFDANKFPITSTFKRYVSDYDIEEDAKYIRVSFTNSVSRDKVVLRPQMAINKPIQMCNAYLPKEIYIAVGRTIEVYNKQVCIEAERYHVQWYCRNSAFKYIGKSMKRKFVIEGKQSQIGDYTLYCRIYDDKRHVIWGGTTLIHIVQNIIASNKTICPIGDSLTNNKPWMAEVINLSNEKISFVGTLRLGANDSAGVQRTGGQEGRSGFKAQDYIKGNRYIFESVGESEHNKFWDGTRFNWSYYKTTYNITCDAVQIFLGTNAIKGLDVFKEATEEVNFIKQMVDYILQDEPNKPIFIVHPPYFGNQNGMGNQSGNDGFSTDATRWEYNQYRGVMDLVKLIDETFSSYSSVHIISVAMTHDSEYNYGAVETPVNPRAVQKEYLPSEAAHPQAQGYYQMADAMFSVYCGVFVENSIND